MSISTKVLTGNATIKILPESVTKDTSIMESNTLGNARIERIGREHTWHQSGVEDTVRDLHNQKNCQEVSQSKEHHESATIKSISRMCPMKRSTRECRNYGYCQAVLQKVHPGSATIKSTPRECHNQKYCQGVSQFKYLRKCHNQKYYQGPPQSNVLSWTATIMCMLLIFFIQIKYCLN